jgi:hypothetical protein
MESRYRTSDLHLAGYLKAKGMRVVDISRGQKVTFIFEDKGESKKLIQEFFNDGMVGVTSFKNAIQDLKTMMYNA